MKPFYIVNTWRTRFLVAVKPTALIETNSSFFLIKVQKIPKVLCQFCHICSCPSRIGQTVGRVKSLSTKARVWPDGSPSIIYTQDFLFRHMFVKCVAFQTFGERNVFEPRSVSQEFDVVFLPMLPDDPIKVGSTDSGISVIGRYLILSCQKRPKIRLEPVIKLVNVAHRHIRHKGSERFTHRLIFSCTSSITFWNTHFKNL